MSDRATLHVFDQAEKEIMKLSRTDKGAVLEFMYKFRNNPDQPGLDLKTLHGDNRLMAARVKRDVRAILLHLGHSEYLLIGVEHRSSVYDDLDRYAYRVNRVTGGIEVMDLKSIDTRPVGVSIIGRHLPSGQLFGAYTDEQLIALGVAEPLLPHVRQLADEAQLLEMAEWAPQLTTDVLFALFDGDTYDYVHDRITQPVQAADQVDVDDLRAAVKRPASQVTTDDEALRFILGESFERWQIFLHPSQRRLVERRFNGAARVSGGPGTGKTIVALHRAVHLARQLPAGIDKPILLTTFNRNLAADLRTRLRALGGDEVLSRVDVVHVDRLADRIVSQYDPRAPKRKLDDIQVPQLWRKFLDTQIGASTWSPEFLAAEWEQVILGQAITSRAGYFSARRPHRGRALARADRDQVWDLSERFVRWLGAQGSWTWRQVAVRAAALAAGSPCQYQHVVVDEAQDLSAAHWRILRALVPAGPDDMFLTGDSHQRIYDNQVRLGSLGINIRGRSARLTLSYRTTRQILAAALEIIDGGAYDDLDGGSDDLAGYRSLLQGAKPVFLGAADWAEESGLIITQLADWGTPRDGSVAICVPTKKLATDVMTRLEAEDIPAVEIGPNGPDRGDGVHVGTMHRLKGLEYQKIIVAGVSDGLVPRQMINRYRDLDPKRYENERQRDRSLLFVAATRARDELAVFWHGTPSPFLGRQRV
ncbi:UvrD-helicase domain-containing protein [Actinoplanes awajinensis]|uniref:DNA 3'-5' helicase n=1 Tax=Actinoplanes awajinensis subsp. mycoplanecinus TaxID=135947 RepID=A0A101JQU4_9ACTN|nr:UvrD-helicase domain-containing protein [Actinoplanes awajinensis]KUL31268.1 DNA helicase [Actinoplanes awajinensis subsp. mycoplanecinus]